MVDDYYIIYALNIHSKMNGYVKGAWLIINHYRWMWMDVNHSTLSIHNCFLNIHMLSMFKDVVLLQSLHTLLLRILHFNQTSSIE